MNIKKGRNEIQQKEDLRYKDLFDNSPIAIREEDFSDVKKYMDSILDSGIEDINDFFYKNYKELEKCVSKIRIIDINKATLDLFEANNKQEFKEEYHTTFSKETFNLFRKELSSLSKGEEIFEAETKINTLKRNQKYVLTRLVLITGYEETWEKVIISHVDISKRIKMEKEAKKNEKFFKIIANNLPNGLIHILDTDFKYIYNAGKELERLNLSNEELIGKTIYDILDPETAQTVSENYKKCLKEKKIVSFEGEYGNSIYMVNCVPILDKNGQVEYILALSVNITKLKEHEKELNLLNQKLKKSNEDLEQFAYIASHDLQEPLRMVSSFTQLLEKKYKEELDEKAHQYIDFIVDGARRMKELIQDLLVYSRVRRNVKPFREVNLNEVLEITINNLKKFIHEKNAQVTYENLPIVKGDKSQLVQLFQNLISNGIKFNKSEIPKIYISVQEDDQKWKFCVKDNGIGIDPKFYEKIFIIFKRLHKKTDYNGTGIGLAVCKKIVLRHGGKIWVNSEPNKGSEFYFTISKNIENLEEKQW
jgi:PAS domain S-box-containing protein